MKNDRLKSHKLNEEEREALKDSDFGILEERSFPMPDAIHVRAAESYFRYAPEDKKAELAHRILLKAEEFGVEIKSETILDWAKKYSK